MFYNNSVEYKTSHHNIKTIKTLIFGDYYAGSQSIAEKYVYNTFKEVDDNVINADFYTRKINYRLYQLKLQFWIVRMTERFARLSEITYRKCDGILIVVDSTKEAGLKQSLIYYDQCKNRNIPVIYLLNKVDSNKRVISK